MCQLVEKIMNTFFRVFFFRLFFLISLGIYRTTLFDSFAVLHILYCKLFISHDKVWLIRLLSLALARLHLPFLMAKNLFLLSIIWKKP